jgi:hypothetical protein
MVGRGRERGRVVDEPVLRRNAAMPCDSDLLCTIPYGMSLSLGLFGQDLFHSSDLAVVSSRADLTVGSSADPDVGLRVSWARMKQVIDGPRFFHNPSCAPRRDNLR